MAKTKTERWIKPLNKPEKACGCVYSIVGYALYLCPKHALTEEPPHA